MEDIFQIARRLRRATGEDYIAAYSGSSDDDANVDETWTKVLFKEIRFFEKLSPTEHEGFGVKIKCSCLIIVGLFLAVCSNFAVAEVSKAAPTSSCKTIEWIAIPEGTFPDGFKRPEEANAAYEDAKLRSSMLEQHTFDAELPRHQVYLSAYEISRYEITNAQYRAFVEAMNRPTPRGHNGEKDVGR